MKSYNKQIRKKLRELTGVAHERELAGELRKLHGQFEKWQGGKIDVFELNNRIHTFHQKTAREIWKMYIDSGYEDMLVVRALKLGILTEDEVGEKLVEQLGR